MYDKLYQEAMGSLESCKSILKSREFKDIVSIVHRYVDLENHAVSVITSDHKICLNIYILNLDSLEDRLVDDLSRNLMSELPASWWSEEKDRPRKLVKRYRYSLNRGELLVSVYAWTKGVENG